MNVQELVALKSTKERKRVQKSSKYKTSRENGCRKSAILPQEVTFRTHRIGPARCSELLSPDFRHVSELCVLLFSEMPSVLLGIP